MREYENGFFIETYTKEFKVNQAIATFLGLLDGLKTPEELADELHPLIQDADRTVIVPLVATFLKDMHRLKVVRREGEPDAVPLTPLYEPGARVGPYVITGLLSLHNYFVQVYHATDHESGQQVVLKMFSHAPACIDSDASLERAWQQFQQEFDVMRCLPPHPCICALQAYYNQPFPFAVLEYLRGDALSDCVRNKQLSDGLKEQLATQVLGALAYVHAHNVVHGDIHARNFMVTEDHVTMIDFGFSYRVGGSAATKTVNGGVPTYLPPERIRQHQYAFCQQPANYRAEVYQIALVLFVLYHQYLPFVGQTWRERAASITTFDFSQHLSPAVPHEQVMLHALQKDPAARYADGREMLAAWQQALAVESAAPIELTH